MSRSVASFRGVTECVGIVGDGRCPVGPRSGLPAHSLVGWLLVSSQVIRVGGMVDGDSDGSNCRTLCGSILGGYHFGGVSWLLL